MNEPLILDTSGWLLALEGTEPYAQLLQLASARVVPGLVLAEVDYHLRRQRDAMHRLLADLATGAYDYQPPTPLDLVRARELDRKFKSASLGLVDSSIAALAERLGVHRILTSDSDFSIVRVGRRFDVSLQLVAPLTTRRRGGVRGR